MVVIYYLLAVLGGYLIGCSNMAYYISRLRGIDMRSGGSKNLGASNAMVLMGWWIGIVVFIHDVGKAVAAVIVAKLLLPGVPTVGAAVGVACVLGHIFPFYLKFKGGKGFAAYFGMTIALNWKLALAVLIGVALITLITDYIVVSTVTTMIAVPTYIGAATGSWMLVLIICIASAVILYKHRENYVRIWNGTEIGFRRANRGDDRQ